MTPRCILLLAGWLLLAAPGLRALAAEGPAGATGEALVDPARLETVEEDVRFG